MKIGGVGFLEGEKTESHRETLSEQGNDQQQTQPTYSTDPQSNPGHIDCWELCSLTTTSTSSQSPALLYLDVNNYMVISKRHIS